MAELRWTRDTVFADHRRGVVARGPGVYDVPEDAVGAYLEHASGGWEQVPPDDPDDDTDTEADAESDDANDVVAEDESDNEDTAAGDIDVNAFLNRTPMADVVDDITAGVADEQLNAVAAAAERKGVQEAVEERRAALSED
jgi:hypothetical protein